MRVAYVCADPGAPVFGTKGCSLHVQEVLRVLVSRGDEVDLFAARLGDQAPHDLRSVRRHAFPIRKTDNAADRERALLDANSSLADALRRVGPFDLVYERHSLWSYAAAEYGAEFGVPSIVEVNAPLVPEQAAHRELIDRAAAEWATRRCFGAATVVACVSEQVAEYARENGALESSVLVTPNGVRVNRFAPRESQAQRGGPRTIGFVGSLRPWHAVDDLLSAFELLADRSNINGVQLVIVGDGPQRDSLERRAAELADEACRRVAFVGQVDPDEIPQWLGRFDVAVAPYGAGDACYFSPLKVFEYFAAGLPVVAARAGQLTELVRDGVTGFVYEPGDVAGLADRIEQLLSDPQKARAMGRAARSEAIALHGWDRVVERALEAAVVIPLAAGGR